MADRERRNLLFAHQEWLGFVQPVGLVVAPTVMVDAQVVPDRNISGRQRDFRELLQEDGNRVTTRWYTPDLRRLFLDYLAWEESDLVDASVHREALEISLPELHIVLSPTWAVPAEDDAEAAWTMLVRVEESGTDLDKPPAEAGGWNATRHARFERLLRETGVPIGLLCTDERIRLIYAPKGESSGHITFEFSQMALPAGRPILAAFDMLLSADALFAGALGARLPALLAKSRDAQAEVSTRLSRQVLAALHELLRGFVAADARGGGTLTDLARHKPDHLYGGLITTLMRLVFVLYAEDRGLMPNHPVYQQHYSLGGLFARLRSDAAAWPDTMDQRFGAWAQLLSLFRLIHGGGSHAGLAFVARKGALFDPNRFQFLEGREPGGAPAIPMVPDATIWKALQSLMVLDGERLSYRTLDVEQIGSVYEAVMGFRVELTIGRSIAVASPKRTGAAVIVNLDSLLELEGGKRAKALQDATDRKLPGNAVATLRVASTVADVVAALERTVDRDATPDIVPAGTPILQPTDERRRSGSHYTPRALTEPIVSAALRPIFERLGSAPKPEAVLDLKVLDPAMGSGAFLVEACRQLAAKLVDAWNAHGGPLDIPPDENELLHARRLIAQRCLYGVDKNPMAVDLARLSIWLGTLARDHEFTFVDHALRHGDFLVGLTQDQIAAVNWVDGDSHQMAFILARDRTRKAEAERARIRHALEELGEEALRPLLERVDRHLNDVRLIGDAVVSAFFATDKPKKRAAERANVLTVLELGGADWQEKLAAMAASLHNGGKPVHPFHFEIEFPEVFDRDNPGFDAIVGNPPFAGHNTTVSANRMGYSDWLRALHPQSSGKCDLVAHFFRRAFKLVRGHGILGLIATNTIAQGDTRSSGLRWICKNGGAIYNAHRRIKWLGEAAVVVSVIHILKGTPTGARHLDGREVQTITAFLFHNGGHDDPEKLKVNEGKSFVGSFILGMGFTFDDTDRKGVATPLAEMRRLIDEDPSYADVIFPYIGGEEVNTSPVHANHRYVINFGERGENECRSFWPGLMNIVEGKVKPRRLESARDSKSSHGGRAKTWWQHYHRAKNLYATIVRLDRVLATNCGATPHLAFSFLSPSMVFAHTLTVMSFDSYASLSALQSRPHEIWARFFSSSMKDDLRYTPSDCFETFPFPENWETHPALEAAGEAYYNFRTAIMIENDEGMTKTYNRFHNPEEKSAKIAKLRDLHAAMDSAVLSAYGWHDIPTECEFLLDYEIDEDAWGNKRKPWRYRWPDEVHNEVLARLLALNAVRAAQERLANDVARPTPRRRKIAS